MLTRLVFMCIAIPCLMMASVSNTLAYESRYVIHRLSDDCEKGSAKDIRGSLIIRNLTRQTIQLEMPSVQGPEYSFSFISDQRVLRPEEEATIHFQGNIRADGKYQVNANIGILIGSEFRAEHTVDLYFIVEKGQFKASTYEELYLQADLNDPEMGEAFLSVEDNGRLPRGEEYQRPMPSVHQMIEMDPKSIFKIPFNSTGPKDCGDEPCRPQTPRFEKNHRSKTLETFTEADILKPKENMTWAVATVVARGEFNWRGMDNLLHPAFGWRVRAWQKVFGGIWIVVAEDWIQWDAKWELNVPLLPIGGGDTRFQYVAFNRFFTPQNSSGNTYRWVGPIRSSLSSPHNEGSWYANTSTGAARGLGEIYREGMTMWSKLYWEGEINPLRGSSIRVFFPNTTYDCGDGTGVPWSCASKDGRIWLIPSHASRNGVMQHELAHQINYEYWDNNLPSGSGGSHNLVDCYNPGLALIEGFANFMVFWTQAGRSSDPNSGFDFRVEDPSFACSSPLNENESWVAATFWDLHDKRFDGSDNLWFIHPGATPAIFLREGKKNGMANFHPVYRSRANAEHRSIIDAIFVQDKIIP